MNRPRRDQFKTMNAFIKALNWHMEHQQIEHVLDWYWHNRLNGVHVPIMQHLM